MKREAKSFEMPCFVRPPKEKARYRFYTHDHETGWPIYELVLSKRMSTGWELVWYRADNESYYRSRLRGPLSFHSTREQIESRLHLKFKRRYAMDMWQAQQYGHEFAVRNARTKEARDALIAELA